MPTWGVLLAVLGIPLLWFLLYRTTLGFEIRAAGANSDAARYAGMKNPPARRPDDVNGRRACAAWRAAQHCSGSCTRIAPGYDTTIGFDAITVALLGRSNPMGIALAGLLLGAMRAGAQSMQISQACPANWSIALQAVILLFLVINLLRRWRATHHVDAPTVAPAEPYGLGAVPAEVSK